MTDQMIPADEVREIAAAMRAAMRRDAHAYPEAKFLADLSGYIKDLEALLPPPSTPLPTLADMPREERRACRWMQADVKGAVVRAVILNPNWEDGKARVMWPGGLFEWIDWSDATPRPDLPRLEWPGDTPTPPPATLTEGSEWDDIDALTQACDKSGRDQITVIDCDGDVFVWGAVAGWWETGTPSDGYEPYTIIHAGKEADQ